MKTLVNKYSYRELEKDTAVVSGLLLAHVFCARKTLEASTKNESALILSVMKDIADSIEEIKRKHRPLSSAGQSARLVSEGSSVQIGQRAPILQD